MKNLILLLFLMPLYSIAQTTHTVAPKENLYSVARLYNVAPRELAAFNNLTIESGINIGQVLKIPGTGKKVSGSPTAATEPVAKKQPTEAGNIPVYHKVEKKETLYHISKLYDRVTVDDIRKWNNLSGDAVTEGTNLIVGYKKGKKDDVVRAEKKANPEIEQKAPVEVATSQAKEKAGQVESVVKVENKPSSPTAAEPKKDAANKITGKSFNGGYFKSLYSQQTENKTVTDETGTAGVFKSTSGWEDGKYYCLHNTAPAGSIIKITNKATQKVVYAKVLDVIPDLKQNTGLVLRLSNAASDELGAGENNFEALINF